MKMPFNFSPNEYVDMLLIFGECRRNSREAARLYHERFPDRRPPSHVTFIMAERKMRTGSFPCGKYEQHTNPVANEDNVINILAYVGLNPHVSLRTLEAELGISKSTIARVVKSHKYHPFKLHLVQGLRPTDFDRRLEFIATMHVMVTENPAFLNYICWSDESRFHNNGVVNKHNAHFWSIQNPHWVQEAHFQNVWSINVWCGLFNGRLIGPYFYDGTLTGHRYLTFLQDTLPELLEEIPLEERRSMWWQQDGAPPHNAQIVTDYLNNVFGEGWIGRSGIIRWPPRSPDLTPLDFFLWGYLKDIVYQTPSQDVEDLKNKIRNACRTITPAMITASCTRHLLQNFESCVACGGAQFEHLH